MADAVTPNHHLSPHPGLFFCVDALTEVTSRHGRAGHKVRGRKPPLWEKWLKLWDQVSKEGKEEDRGKRAGDGVTRAREVHVARPLWACSADGLSLPRPWSAEARRARAPTGRRLAPAGQRKPSNGSVTTPR